MLRDLRRADRRPEHHRLAQRHRGNHPARRGGGELLDVPHHRPLLQATFENWESEFLQMGAFVLLTVYLLQRGSGESKQESDDPRDEDPRHHRHDPDAPWPVRRGGAWLYLYERSLLIAFGLLFVLSIVGHAIAGAHEYTAEQHEHGEAGVGAWQFIRRSEFWFQSFQNWQSEFLAVGCIVVLSVFLRQ